VNVSTNREAFEHPTAGTNQQLMLLMSQQRRTEFLIAGCQANAELLTY
jgi:hypothetical protein